MDVRQALLQVPEDFRAVMILHDVHDLRQEEVAAIVGVPVGTVKSRLHRGRIALAKAMGIQQEGRTSDEAGATGPDEPLGGPGFGERADAAGPSEGTVSP